MKNYKFLVGFADGTAIWISANGPSSAMIKAAVKNMDLGNSFAPTFISCETKGYWTISADRWSNLIEQR